MMIPLPSGTRSAYEVRGLLAEDVVVLEHLRHVGSHLGGDVHDRDVRGLGRLDHGHRASEVGR